MFTFPTTLYAGGTAHFARTVILPAGTTSWAKPADWSSYSDSHNTIECLGSGGTGATNGGNQGGGGGGGAYAKRANVALLSNGDFPVTVVIPTVRGTTKTQFNAAHAGREVVADFGRNAVAPAGGAGGLATNSTGTTKFDGGLAGSGGTAGFAGSGGGAAGPSGAGSAGGHSTGGAADNGTVAGGAANSNGNSGTEFDPSHGCGSGAGAPTSNGNGRTGGNYGGGGSGAFGGGMVAGAGAAPLIVINYTT